ncbi:MAG: helix-turn-helix transcriptional regulator [Methylococcales bacterium]|nr:helix-turn-helix transcriptional regulator [Methylococcales bacterium]
MRIGERIKELRKNKGLNQSKLAKSVNSSTAMISVIEANKSKPTLELLTNFSEFFQVSTDYLLKGEEPIKISVEEREILDVLREDKAMTEAVMKFAKVKKKAISYLESYTAMNAQGLK